METQLEFKKVLITPQLAKELLSKNNTNRVISKGRISLYANDMLEGRWKENTAEFIKVADNGDILDGQHRLLAIVQSNCPIWFHTAFGLNKSVFDVLDTGKVRSSADAFSVEKIDNYKIISSTVKGYLVLTKNNMTTARESLASQKLTNTIVLEEYSSRPEFWQEVCSFSQRSYRNFSHILSPSFIGTLYSYLYNISPEDSRNFINQVCSGDTITNSSITVLRRALLKDKVSSRKMQFPDKFAIIIKTWNAFRLGKNYQIIKFDKNTENTPKPI